MTFYLNSLVSANLLKTFHLGFVADWRKSKLHAARCEGVNDLGDVVTNNCKSGRGGVGFDNSAESSLSIASHTVSFVQNNKLELWDISAIRMLGYFTLGELLYFLSNYLDTSLVRGV